MDFYTKTVKKSLETLNSDPGGLSKSEVAARALEYGPNAISVKGEPLWRKLVEPFRNVFMAVLFVAVAVSVWHHEYIDAAIIGAIMGTNALIYYVQRFSTERILRALQKTNQHIVDVIRDGTAQQIDAVELVPGDIVVLEEGEKIPADCRLVKTASLRVDESQLTGESLPVEKSTDELPSEKELYERTNMIYQGSFVVGGEATALVVATGNATEFGKLAALSMNVRERSPVQERIDALISMLVRVIAAIAAVAFALALWRGMEMTDAIRYVLALSVSAVPESLPVAITVVLVLGMRRMARQKALVKSPAAIETVGIVTTIATDKTGTLTKNKLTVQELWSDVLSDKEMYSALAHAVLPQISKTRDPLDQAMDDYLDEHHRRRPDPKLTLPFDQLSAMSGNVFETRDGTVLWVKGAPEKVIERCHMSKSEREQAHNTVRSMAASGLRVLAIASFRLEETVDSFDAIENKKGELAGLIGVADVLRAEAPAAIQQARAAGIRVAMVTGDHFETAFHIGKQLGIVESSDEVFDSRGMHELTDDELEKVVEKTRVFARVIPENKHRLLEILKRNHVTAMTGDGVNDVPALTGAHVGVAMGSGTTIAKDAGDIILLDNNFRSIVRAVAEGRTIYTNIKRMVAYLLSTNAGEVLVAIGSLVIGVPVPLVAVQILWVNLVTDTCMVIPIGLEPGEARTMTRPPIKPRSPLFSKFMLTRIVLTASVMAALALSLYLVFINSHGVEYARTIVFNALVVMQWANAFNMRSDYETLWYRIRRMSWPFYAGLALAIVSQFVALSSNMHSALHIYAMPSAQDLLWTTACAFVVPIVMTEIHKWIGRRFYGKGLRQKNTPRVAE